MVEYWKKAACVLGIGSWTDSLDFAVLMYTVAMLVTEWGIGPVETTWIITGFGISGYISMVIGLLTGPLMDYFGRKKIWVLGNAVAGISYLFAATAANWMQVAIYRMIGVWTVGFTLTAWYVMLPEEVPADKRQFILGLTGLLNTIGATTVYGLMALSGLFPWLTWRVMCLFTGLADLAATVMGIIWLREPPIWQERRKLMKEGKIKKEEQRMSYRELLGPKWRKKFLVLMWLPIVFAATGLATATSGYLSFFQAAVMKFPAPLIGMIGVVSQVIIACTRPIIGKLSDKFGRLNSLLFGAIPGLIGMLLLWHTNVLIGVGPSLTVIAGYVFFYFLWSLAGWSQQDTARLALAEAFPTVARGTAQSLSTGVIASLIMTPLGVVSGLLATVISPSDAYSIVPTIGFIVGITAVLIAKKLGYETAGKALE